MTHVGAELVGIAVVFLAGASQGFVAGWLFKDVWDSWGKRFSQWVQRKALERSKAA
jgi:hypothetical protein